MAEVARDRAAESVISTGRPDAAAGGPRCPTCGQAVPRQPADPPQPELDESLLHQVSAALRAQSALSRQTAEHRVQTARRLFKEAVVIHDLLHGQAALLRVRLAEREARVQALREALGRVEEAMTHAAPSVRDATSTIREATSTMRELPRDRTCPAVARGLLREHVGEHLSPRELEDAMVITSELATNAYVHGEGRIELTLSRCEDRLRIEVSDEGRPTRIDVVRPDERDVGGRGLLIVEQLASDWGAVSGFGHVWAELPLEGSGQ
jgi:anti-sigma regulatory factor (Ser/Thr protein kinase)